MGIEAMKEELAYLRLMIGVLFTGTLATAFAIYQIMVNKFPIAVLGALIIILGVMAWAADKTLDEYHRKFKDMEDSGGA